MLQKEEQLMTAEKGGKNIYKRKRKNHQLLKEHQKEQVSRRNACKNGIHNKKKH